MFMFAVMVAVYNDSRHEAITRCYLNQGDSFGVSVLIQAKSSIPTKAHSS